MTQDQNMHQHPTYALTMSMFVAETVFRLVCWGEALYRAIHRRVDTGRLRRAARHFINQAIR